MKRILYWAGMTLYIAIGIGICQLLQNYYGALPEVTVGQIVHADETTIDAEPALTLTPNEANEDAESANDDRRSTKAGGREETVGEKAPVAEVSPTSIAPTIQSNSASPTERDESSVDTDQKPESSHDHSKHSGEHNYYGAGADGRRAFGGWYGGPFPTPRAREGGVWSKGVGITWSKDRDVLRGFSQTLGDWATIRIKPPERVIPILGVNVAAVSVGSNMAAFSGVTCTWDLLKPSQPFTSQPEVGPDLVTIRSADHIYTFAAAFGKWTSPTDDTLQRDSTTNMSRPVGPNAIGSRGDDDRKNTPPKFDHIVVDPAPEQEALWADGVGLKWSKDKDVLYGYSFVIGEWIALDIGPQDRIVPKVYGTVATVQDRNGIAAFSGISGGWDRLELSEPFAAQPRFVDDSVRLQTKDQLYIFAARYGKWTSPVDAHPAQVFPTTTDSSSSSEPSHDHHDDGHTIAQLEEAWEHAERKTVEVALGLQRAYATEDELDELRKELRDAVESAFSARQMLQEARMNEMRDKLSQIKTALQSRAQRRDRIIERRVEELQDPGLNWQSLRGAGASSSRGRNQLKNATRLPLGDPDPGSPSSTEPPWGKPATGTPVGLPGPPNISLRNAGAAKTPPELADSAPPAFSGSGTTPANSLPAFDWEKADSMQTLMNGFYGQLHDKRSQINTRIKTIEQLRVPWQEASETQRDAVEKILRSPSAANRGGFGGTPGQEVGLAPIVVNEERYEKLRVERLQVEWRYLEKSLREADGALDGLNRYWARYQGTLSDLRLILREVELVMDAASQIEEIEMSRVKMGVGDRSKNINARVAAERARINVERATRYVRQMEQIGNENPQFEPTQYGEELQRSHELLDKVREENPELELITVPGGSGGGFF